MAIKGLQVNTTRVAATGLNLFVWAKLAIICLLLNSKILFQPLAKLWQVVVIVEFVVIVAAFADFID